MSATQAIVSPRVIVFDVNETLLDLAPVAAAVRECLGGEEQAFRLWFSRLLHYSLVMDAWVDL